MKVVQIIAFCLVGLFGLYMIVAPIRWLLANWKRTTGWQQRRNAIVACVFLIGVGALTLYMVFRDVRAELLN